MQDAKGEYLQQNDLVAFINRDGYPKVTRLSLGRVLAITPKMVKLIEDGKDPGDSYNHRYVRPNQLVKV